MKGQIKNFDRYNLRELRTEIDASLQSLSKKYGITIKTGNARFTATTAAFKLDLVAAGDSGVLQTKGEADFKRYASRYGLALADLGREFTSPGSGRKFKIAGLNPRAHRFPISAIEIATGRMFKFPVSAVQSVAKQILNS